MEPSCPAASGSVGGLCDFSQGRLFPGVLLLCTQAGPGLGKGAQEMAEQRWGARCPPLSWGWGGRREMQPHLGGFFCVKTGF